ncbi:MAG: MerR family transcriptional regulator [Chloroflexota bacterium]|nr:MerR family transcriptional regulator [Chloroflexota bacterium]
MPEYNTRAVANRTGVPADTFRAWERRYGLPRPSRSGGNQRLYSERDIAVISWLREQTAKGLSISQAVVHAARALDAAAAADVSEPPVEVTPKLAPRDIPDDLEQRYTVLTQRLVAALLVYDAAGAGQVVEEATALLPLEQICLGILQPALADIGERWARGEISVSVEHFASGFVLRRLGALFNASRPESGSPTVLTACAEGELHEVGLLVLSLFLSRHGYRVVHLGANVPTADLRQAILRIVPDAVVLSASTEHVARGLVTSLRTLSEWLAATPLNGSTPVICAGGRAFVENPSLREGISAHYLGDDAMMALSELSRLTRSRA